jgi:hypothetical protein
MEKGGQDHAHLFDDGNSFLRDCGYRFIRPI